MKPRHRVTLDDLARAADLSRSGASKALRDDPSISSETRRRVQELAREIGYIRDPALSRLAHYRWNRTPAVNGECVAYLYPFGKDHGYDEQLKRTCEKIFISSGYTFSPFFSHDQTPRRLIEILTARGIRAVIFPKVFDQSFAKALNQANFICVAVAEGAVIPDCELIRPDYLWALRDAIRRLYAADCGSLALVLRDDTESTPLAEYMEAIWVQKGQSPECVLFHDTSKNDPVQEWLARKKPDATITMTSDQVAVEADALGVKRVCLRLFSKHVGRVDGYYLSDDSIARRALNYIEGRLKQAGEDEHFGTTLIAPRWIPAVAEKPSMIEAEG